MSDLEILDWRGLSEFYYNNMFKKKEIADGSCYFHAIADSFYKKYQLGQVNKIDFIKKLRKDLSIKLDDKIYNKLSRGKLYEYSKGMPEFKLENMKKLLDSSEYVDNRFNEFISNLFNKDIYILNEKDRDVYITGRDDDILYKHRESIVIIWNGTNHYDLVGILSEDKFETLFDSNHPFILYIKNRINDKLKIV